MFVCNAPYYMRKVANGMHVYQMNFVGYIH